MLFSSSFKVVFPTLSQSGPATSRLLSFVTGVTDILYGLSVTLLLSVVTGVTDFLDGFSVTLLVSIVTDVTGFLRVVTNLSKPVITRDSQVNGLWQPVTLPLQYQQNPWQPVTIPSRTLQPSQVPVDLKISLMHVFLKMQKTQRWKLKIILKSGKIYDPFHFCPCIILQLHPAGDVLWVFVEPGNVVP